MKTITGGCACGAIRYEVTAEPIVTFNCHCRDCQKTTGGGYTPVFYVPASAFKFTKGAPKYFGTTSEMMGDNVRGFCPECGSRLFGGKSDFGQGIAAGTLDDPSLQTAARNLDVRRATMGRDGPQTAEVREICAAGMSGTFEKQTGA